MFVNIGNRSRKWLYFYFFGRSVD